MPLHRSLLRRSVFVSLSFDVIRSALRVQRRSCSGVLVYVLCHNATVPSRAVLFGNLVSNTKTLRRRGLRCSGTSGRTVGGRRIQKRQESIIDACRSSVWQRESADDPSLVTTDGYPDDSSMFFRPIVSSGPRGFGSVRPAELSRKVSERSR